MSGGRLSPLLSPAGGEDDKERPLAQKEAMSQQMTEILLDRVHDLNATFDKFKRTLQSDVDASTDLSTAQLFQERNAMVAAKARVAIEEIPPTLKLAGLLTTRVGTAKPSRVYTAKHLFKDRPQQSQPHQPSGAVGVAHAGPARNVVHHGEQFVSTAGSATGSIGETKPSLTRSSSSLHTSAAVAHTASIEEARERILQERELHCIADRHVTRSIEKVTYYYGSEPFDCQPELMLGYVRTHIKLPPHENVTVSFARVTRTPLVRRAMKALFWYCVCRHFVLPKNLDLLEHERVAATRRQIEAHIATAQASLRQLRSDLSTHYVMLMRLLNRKVAKIKRDLVHLYVPFAIGKAILTGLRYLCPGSRHLYRGTLQQDVYETCCELLLGAQLSAVSIQATRARLFDDELHKNRPGDVSAGNNNDSDEHNQQDRDTASNTTPSNARGSKSSEESASRDPAANHDHEDGADDGHPELTPSEVASASKFEGDDSLDEELYRTTLQPRERYDATLVGTLLGEFLVAKKGPKASMRPGTSAPHLVYRTMPASNARVGGTWTFRRSKPTTQSAALNARYAQERESFETYLQKSRATLASHIRGVSTRQESVLNGGMEGVGRFCMDLAQAKVGHRGARSADGSISGESKGTRNTHLQGEKRLDWHANLAVKAHLPPADRVIAAKDKIEASKMRERQKARTHARIMLLP